MSERRDRDSPVPGERISRPRAPKESDDLRDALRHLQRTAGNRAVNELLGGDAKATLDSPGLRLRDSVRARRSPGTEIGFAVQREASGPTALLRRGSRGAEVTAVQQLLGVEADGIFGGGTQAAVIAFQRDHGLVADGVVGPLTMAALGGGSGSGAAPVASGGGDDYASGETFKGGEEPAGEEKGGSGESFGGEKEPIDDEGKS